MNQQINHIISFWSRKFKDASPKKQDKIKDSVQQLREEMKTKLWTPEGDEWFWFQDAWYIYGEYKDYKPIIHQDGYECLCHSYQCSAEGIENKIPCKHLYVLACWAKTDF